MYFFDERPGLSERPIEWAPLLKGRKLNECPGAHSDNYGKSSANGDKTYLIFHVTLQDYDIKGSYHFVGGSS